MATRWCRNNMSPRLSWTRPAMASDKRAFAATVAMLVLLKMMCLVTSLPASMSMPLVDPGLFVISGVKTCGNNSGYCLLGPDCTTDDDFLPDSTGHCEGLKRAFTPSASFSCCKFNNRTTVAVPAIDGETAVAFDGTTTNRNIRNVWQVDVDPAKVDVDQLAKLHHIETVVKTIVEQLINETANQLKHKGANKESTAIADSDNGRTENLAMEAAADETNEDAVVVDSSGEEETPTTEKPEPEMTVTDLELKAEPVDTAQDEDSMDEDEYKAGKDICKKTCKSEITFATGKRPICYGTLIDDIWILTSATCASRIHKADMRKVLVSRKSSTGVQGLGISNILVHEDFKSPAIKNAPDHNDLALVSLTVPILDGGCSPCLQRSNVTTQMCKNFQGTIVKNTVKNAENCEDRLQMKKFINSHYYVLPCNRWRMQYNKEGHLGSGLWCNGILAGVQTGVGVGSLIYTPVNEHNAWISDNRRNEERK
ncbi:uncharacterized protein LOC126833825 [Adelges cooleyi]|uniref:uncharacterized protein LOC126833825 n=1 Tax=Adelges cooleyi TaxID=133065 RepID=UPI00217F5560|nr:uncharacterized protein LOC126833825 [Adelges cooleyi]